MGANYFIMKISLPVFFIFLTVFCYGQPRDSSSTIITIDVKDPEPGYSPFWGKITHASFKEGADAWKDYLKKSFNTKSPFLQNLPTHNYELNFNFNISETGRLEEIKSLSNQGIHLEADVMTAMSKSPKWTPARGNQGRFAQGFFQKIIVSVKNNAPLQFDERAGFPGGNLEWNLFVNQNLNTSVAQVNHATPGSYRVDVQFIVQPDGRFSKPEALTKHGFGMEEEVMRVLMQSPKWKPAVWKGTNIHSKVIESILFEVKDINADATAYVLESSAADYDKPAEYSGGYLGFRNLLIESLRDDIGAINGAPAGEYPVQVIFTVEKNGDASNFKPLTNFGYGMEEEFVRLLQHTKWKPAEKNNLAVNSVRAEGFVFQTPMSAKNGFARAVEPYSDFFINFMKPFNAKDRQIILDELKRLAITKTIPASYQSDIDPRLYLSRVQLNKKRAVIFFTTQHDIFLLNAAEFKTEEDIKKHTAEALRLKQAFLRDMIAFKKTYGNYGLKNTSPSDDENILAPALASAEPINENVVYRPDIQPHYPGGITGWKKYVASHLKFDVAAINGASEGDFPAAVQFIVHKDGRISNIMPLTRTGFGTEKELARLVEESGKWNPGKVKGEPVTSYHTVAIKFQSTNMPPLPSHFKSVFAKAGVRSVTHFKNHIDGFINSLSQQTKSELGNILNWLTLNQKITDTYFTEVVNGIYAIHFTSGSDKIMVYFATNYDIYLLNGYISSSPVIEELELGKAKQLKLELDKEIAATYEKNPGLFNIFDIAQPEPRLVYDETIRDVKTGTLEVKDVGIALPSPSGGNHGKGIVEVRKPGSEPEPEIFTRVEIDAAFPGGSAAWRNFLETNLDGNIPVKKGAPVGTFTVVVQFIVDLNGNISDVIPLTRLGYGMEEEAIRVIKKSGKWRPAIQNGREVRAYRRQPITFQVIEAKTKGKE